MRPQREGVARHMADLLDGDALLCLPTAPGIAPKLATPQEELEGFRARAFGGYGRACTRVTVGGKSRPVLRAMTKAA